MHASHRATPANARPCGVDGGGSGGGGPSATCCYSLSLASLAARDHALCTLLKAASWLLPLAQTVPAPSHNDRHRPHKQCSGLETTTDAVKVLMKPSSFFSVAQGLVRTSNVARVVLTVSSRAREPCPCNPPRCLRQTPDPPLTKLRALSLVSPVMSRDWGGWPRGLVALLPRSVRHAQDPKVRSRLRLDAQRSFRGGPDGATMRAQRC